MFQVKLFMRQYQYDLVSNRYNMSGIATFRALGNMGRLGNQLFQMAATIGYALDNDKEFCFPRWAYQDYITIPLGYVLNPITEISEENLRYHPLPKVEGDVNIHGHLLSTLYFKHHREMILKYFSLEKKWHNYIEKKYGHILSKNTCAIHVRRGDYLEPEQLANQGCMILSYYDEAIETILPNQHPYENITFVICSDDIEWCKKEFKHLNCIFIEGENEIIDLFIMSKCKHNIICNSTFGWWAAWLNKNPDKKVVAPRQWFKNTQGWDDLYGDNWIVI